MKCLNLFSGKKNYFSMLSAKNFTHGAKHYGKYGITAIMSDMDI